MNLFDKLETIWSVFVRDDILVEVDRKSQEQIQKLKPDFRECLKSIRCSTKVNRNVSTIKFCVIRSGAWQVSLFCP